MQVEIKIYAEAEDEETVEDAVTILETTMPYIFDNVVITSQTSEYNSHDEFDA